jgi:hypothetical protein
VFQNDPRASPLTIAGGATDNGAMAIAPPRRPPSQDELDALVRQARARHRRRRLLGAGLVALAAGLALSIYAVASGGSHSARRGRGGTSDAVGSFPRCRSDQLRLAGPLANGAGTGHYVENFTFTNGSSSTCMLRGWPTVSAVLPSRIVSETPSRSRVPNGAVRTGRPLPVRAVRLRPRDAASFNVIWVSTEMFAHPPRCVRSFGELVTPPGAHVPLRVVRPRYASVWPPKYCGLHLGVTPLVPGRIDRYQAG